MSRRIFQTVFFILTTFLLVSTALAGKSGDDVWQETDVTAMQRAAVVAERTVVPKSYRTFTLNKDSLRAILNKAPIEFTSARQSNEVILTLPMPDGSFARFLIEKSPVVEAGLSAKYPELGETYRGQGIDDPTATVRLDFLPTGFHSMILSPNGTVLVDPYFKKGDTENYVSYLKKDAPRTENFVCNFRDKKSLDEALSPDNLLSSNFLPDSSENVVSGTQLRTYRLALAATQEYTAAVGGGTVAGALAAQVLIMNRVNAVYEREVAIHMNIVANNDQVVFTAEPDGYTNNDGEIMLDENTAKLNTVIGTANYDIGHVFSTGGGGIAALRASCGTFKAEGVTGLPNPIGDAFAIDFVAHEMGHQWGGNHTFNTSCGGNRNTTTAYETGSGITIMGYAGVCGAQDLALHSIDTFHVKSLEEIVAFSQTGAGNTCAATTSTGNTPPTVSSVGGTSFNIPKQTPFALTATGTDVNGDSLTYDWQEYDLGASTSAIPNTDSAGARPILRPYLPNTSGIRVFPALQYILNNANVPPSTYNCGRATACLTGELLPQIGRTMNFQAVARDNRTNGGGISTVTAQVIVDGNSGPLAVTSPNTPVTVTVTDTTNLVTWNVANTTAAPVNAANVKISVSIDGGQTFPYVLTNSTPNDGSQQLFFPTINTTTARLKIEAVNNIFFDISDTNFTIDVQPFTGPDHYFDFDGDGKTDISIFRPASGEWWINRSSSGQTAVAQFGNSSDVLAPADYSGDGKTDIAVWRPSTGEWFILRSENNSFYSTPFGSTGDVPAPGDFDGDTKADIAVFRPSNATWYISKSSGGTTIQTFGVSTDKPVVGDYDGDNKDDIAIYRPSVSEWWLLRSTAGLIAGQFGSAGDKAVPADYSGDGKTDIAVWRPSTGEWYILRSENNSFFSLPFGASGDVPAPGDYDGDGKADVTVFRPSNNTWYSNRTSAGILITGFGTTGDAAIPNAFVR
jgi:putative transposon-encoded protein